MDRAPRGGLDQPGVLERRIPYRSSNPLVEWIDSWRWTDSHKRLAAQPVFAACSRTEIRNLRRWGDEVDVGPGQVLLRENAIGYAFVVVLAGRLAVTSHGRQVATLGPGAHVGDIAILGFGPQPAMVTTLTPCELFVLGRRFLVSLAVDSPGVREGLFPGLDAHAATEVVRGMREPGLAAFRKMRPNHDELAAPGPAPSISWAPTRRARETVFSTTLDLSPHPAHKPLTLPHDRGPRRKIAAIIGAVATLLAATFAFTWHVPALIAHPARPIDVTSDLTVSGRPTGKVNGHYILLSVTFESPTLAAYVFARARGETMASRARDRDAFEQTVHKEFVEGEAAAVLAAAKATGVDAASLMVGFAPRDLGGPSASLVYALTLADMLDPADLAYGRTIAATGQVDGDGKVHRVGLINEKVRAARASGATMLLVPVGQNPGKVGIRIVEVATLADAIAALRQPALSELGTSDPANRDQTYPDDRA